MKKILVLTLLITNGAFGATFYPPTPPIFTQPAANVAMAFANRQAITDPVAQTELISMASFLQNGGINVSNGDPTATNLVDLALFNPRYKAGSNTFTWAGNIITMSNITFSTFGAAFQGAGLITWPLQVNCWTNTFVIVWRGYTTNLGTGQQQWLGGLINTDPTKYSAQWLYQPNNTGLKFTIRETNTFYNNLGNETILQPSTLQGFFDFNLWNNFNNQRHVTSWTSSGVSGIYTFTDNGFPMKYGFTTPAFSFTNTAIEPTNALNQVMLGVDPLGPSGGFQGGYNRGEIAAVLIFNKVLTTNQLETVYRAVRQVENGTCNYVWFGDSEFSGAPYTNLVPQYVMDSNLHQNESAWENAALGGITAVQLNNNTNFYHSLTLNSPTGKVTRAELYIEAGINDFYNLASTTDTMSNNIAAIAKAASDRGFKVFLYTVEPLGTNSNSGYVYSAATEAAIDLFNLIAVTNGIANLAGVIRRDLIFGATEMDTNFLYSADGLHPSGSKGWMLNRRLADISIGLQPIPLGNVVSMANGYTLKIGDAILYATTTGSFTIKLPAAPAHGEQHYIKKISADANTLTVDGNGRNIDGAATQTTIVQYAGFRCQYDINRNVWFLLK